MGTCPALRRHRIIPYSYRVLLSLIAVLLLAAGSLAAQVTLAPDPARLRGDASAPVTIIEFSDYQ